jgi:NADH-quinone oxidoreductase subunit G
MSETTENNEAPKDPNSVTLTIDGREVTVAKGTKIIDAAKTDGIELPSFCYHPGLSIAACCRQCLVEIEGQGKLQPSCQLDVADGMVVNTQADRAVLARKQMLEFTLVNHPIDCPICDKAGECMLQKHYFDHDNAGSRVDVPKVRKPKVKDLGPHIVLDAERCILCTRCIRVCDEVAGEHQLEMANRGDHEELGTAPGAALDNPYSINTVDVCPVGALTSKDFRFTMRAWELSMTPSVCQGCSTGCNVEVQFKSDRVWRIQPDQRGSEANEYWMCDEGRFSYHGLRENRLAAPFIDGLPASWDKALSRAAGLISGAIESDRSAVGVVFSPQHSNEDNWALAKLVRDIWQLDRFYVGGRAPVPGRADEILRDADVNPNRFGVRQILGDQISPAAVLEQHLLSGELKALVVLGHELALSREAIEKAAELDFVVVIADSEKRAPLGCARCGSSLYVGPEATEVGCERCRTVNEVPFGYDTDQSIVDSADIIFPSAAWAEIRGTVTNRAGTCQRMYPAVNPPGQAQPAWQIISRLGVASGATIAYDNARAVFKEFAAATDTDETA